MIFVFSVVLLLPSVRANVLTISCVYSSTLLFMGPRLLSVLPFRRCRVNWPLRSFKLVFNGNSRVESFASPSLSRFKCFHLTSCHSANPTMELNTYDLFCSLIPRQQKFLITFYCFCLSWKLNFTLSPFVLLTLAFGGRGVDGECT